MPSINAQRHGTDEPPPVKTSLRAGPLSLTYIDGGLRGIFLGEREVVRRVYAAVRDENWGTVPALLSDERLEIAPDGFRITYQAEHRQGGLHFVWRGRITGRADGMIEFTLEGTARTSFRRSRIGLCVLHPPAGCAGQPCAVTHGDGTVETCVFPEAIAPHQPFRDVRILSSRVGPDVWADVAFEGETFETEDQRNWTDASYKTYGTPLDLPHPVWIAEGTTVSQAVTLTLRGPLPPAVAEPEDGPVRFSLHAGQSVPLPGLGLGVAHCGRALTAEETARLASLHLDHLRVDVTPSDPAHPARLRQASGEARAVGARLLVALRLSQDAPSELARLCAIAAELGTPLRAWLVYFQGEKCVSEDSFQIARRALAAGTPGVPIFGGTDAYFAELNRARPALSGADGVAYSVNPQAHAFDDESLMETPEAQSATASSARRLYGDLPVWVSPLTLRPRFNPDAGPDAPEGEPPADARQRSLLAAAWTLASVKSLAEGGAAGLTYFETAGPRGLMEAGSVFPVFYVLAWLGEFADGEVLPSASSRPGRVECLALRKKGRQALLLANLTPEPQCVMLGGLTPRRVERLDETTGGRVASEPPDGTGETILLPYAVARIALGDSNVEEKR